MVHGFGQWAGDEVPHKHAVFLHIAHRVFQAGAREANDGRDVVKSVEKAVGREVQNAVVAAGRYPADGAWANDGVEGVVGQPVAVFGLVKMRHLATVNANAPAGCRPLAKPLRAWALDVAFGHDGQHIQFGLVVGFDVGQAFAQAVFAGGLGNQAELIDQQFELRSGQGGVRFGV